MIKAKDYRKALNESGEVSEKYVAEYQKKYRVTLTIATVLVLINFFTVGIIGSISHILSWASIFTLIYFSHKRARGLAAVGICNGINEASVKNSIIRELKGFTKKLSVELSDKQSHNKTVVKHKKTRNPHKNIRWTRLEELELMDLITSNGISEGCRMFSRQSGRTAHACSLRYQLIKNR